MLPNCVAFAAAEADPARKAELFGACGVAPAQLMGLPTSACSETDSAMPSESSLSRLFRDIGFGEAEE